MAAIEFTRELYIPHPKQDSSESPQLLRYMINPSAIADELADMPPDQLQEAKLAAADYIADQVRKTLWYPEVEGGRDDFKDMDVSRPPKLEDLRTKQAADCIGFTLVTSVFLEKSTIDHWIGFANGHATILVDGNTDRSLPMLDPLSPELDQDIRPAIVNTSPLETKGEISKYSHTALVLDAARMAKGLKKPLEEVFVEHPWMLTKPFSELENRFNEESAHAPSLIVMSLFPPATGQVVLEAYSQFQHSILQKDYYEAAKSLQMLMGRFPDMDARKRHTDFKAVLADLAVKGQKEWALNMIRGYFSTFDFINDSRFVEAEADCLKLVAQITKDSSVGRQALATYERALEMPRSYKTAIAGKIGKLAARIDQGSGVDREVSTLVY